MARLYGDAQGHILRITRDDEAGEPEHATPLPGATVTLDVDEETNAGILAALGADWNSHDCVGGVLRRNGQAVPIQPTGRAYRDRQALQALRDKLEADQSLTAAELRVLLRVVLRLLLRRGR